MRAVLACVAVFGSAILSGHVAQAQTRTQTHAPVADPAPDARADCADTGDELRYLVVFDRGTTQQAAEAEIAQACGRTTVYYPQIAVAVVTSDAVAFADAIGRERAFSAEGEAISRPDDGPGRRRIADETTPTHAPITSGAEAVSEADRTDEQWNMRLIGAEKAHAVTEGSRDVVVGVLDSGIDPKHPDLAKALDPALSAGCLTGRPDPSPRAWEPTSSAHGTHVAGIIAAADDGKGVTGVAPGVRVASVKVVDDSGFIYPEYAVCGLMWAAAKGMTVTNNSYFVDPWLFTCDTGRREHVVYEAVRRAVDYASGAGVAHVAAATNSASDLTKPRAQNGKLDRGGVASSNQARQMDSSCDVLPAGLRGVTAVSAVGPNKLKAGYSAYGLGVVDVAAPGGERAEGADPEAGCVLSTVPNGYEYSCGTSMATPHATGVLALLASAKPHASPTQLARSLATQAESLPCPTDYDLNGSGTQDAYCSGYGPFNGFHGHGLVDALAAVN
ncbi:S8 family serine peptidase [Herbihabitans rhizosphaerae]